MISACNPTDGGASLEDEVFINTIRGTYHLTPLGVKELNTIGKYFSSSITPNFTTQDLFEINNYGQINIKTSNICYLLNFSYAITGDLVGIFEIEYPTPSQSGSLIISNRFLKISLDKHTNLLFSAQYTNSSKNAESLTSSILMSSPI